MTKPNPNPILNPNPNPNPNPNSYQVSDADGGRRGVDASSIQVS